MERSMGYSESIYVHSSYLKIMLGLLAEAVSARGLSIEPLRAHVAIEASSLPETFHCDPANRLIVATARVSDAALMTRDQLILDYAARGHLTAIAA